MLRRTFLMSLLLGLLALGATAQAHPGAPGLATASAADAAVTVDVAVIHATSRGSVDKRLADLEKTLLRAFRGYLGFTLLSEEKVKLGADQAHHMALPNGTELDFKYLGVEDGFLRLHLEVGGLKSTVRVKSGSTFFQAGRGYKDGMIVLAFRASTGG